MPDLASRIDAELEREAEALLELSHRIHANPEIRFEEFQASTWLADALEERGFRVERGVGGFPTAFRATMAGKGGGREAGQDGGRAATPDGARATGPNIAILCEYDALPAIGHACGHNVIATMGAGAAFALAPLMAELPGTLTVIGTPAEEGGGGKILLLDAGVFDGVDAAMMIHPYPRNEANMPTLASTKWEVTFHGKPAHAAMAPHLGVNALDAVRLAFAGIDALRQQVRQDVRIHAIVTDGGAAANVIPERAAMLAVARAADATYLFEDLVPRLRDVFEGAALMTGARLEVGDASPAYLEMTVNEPLEAAFTRHATRRGRTVTPYDPNVRAGSTDMGNVSQVMPALHGMLAIDDIAMPHTAAFAVAARSPRGDQTVLDGASVLANVAAELLTDPALLEQARAAFEATTGRSPGSRQAPA
jgi:amidohydrolase